MDLPLLSMTCIDSIDMQRHLIFTKVATECERWSGCIAPLNLLTTICNFSAFPHFVKSLFGNKGSLALLKQNESFPNTSWCGNEIFL